ncbi:Crp/Fnr family transcription regulator [Hyphomicrobium nitrativorans NL23]|uniref:Crp/Fnr family transcription regulator n=1 Tax=Hyphomicrobium nitrativorans NL23 TaxID=1029756 RepID=V5SE64_9HYPH|nr:helix-turn-helix domain-containing protein [Hyphomicrobium nitrativorans]AHB48330.1 Crp/Fnr family transcription regulator [Hyphomicrobium nitrativorans NL23]
MLAVQTLDARPFQTPLGRLSRGEAPQRSLEDRLAHATVRKIESKEHVFCEGDPRLHVFRVEEGVIAIYKTLCDGRRRIIDFAYPGDLLGLGVLDEHILSAQATSAAKVRCFSAASLEAMAENDADLALKLYKSVCQELSATRSLLVTVGQRSAVERVAAFLLGLRRRSGDEAGETVKLAMRRSDIADLLGLTIETVSRTLTKLRTMGVIDVELGGTTVTLRDAARLADLANE